MARDHVCPQAVRSVNEKPRPHSKNPAHIRKCGRGLSCFHLSQGYSTWKQNVETSASFLLPQVPGEILLRFQLTSFRDNGEASFCGSSSTPERGPAGSVQRIGQGRLVILLALAFKLLLGFPEARDARCDFGAVARESFFLLRHRPSVSCLIL